MNLAEELGRIDARRDPNANDRAEKNRELCRKYKVKLVSTISCGCFLWYILVCFFIGFSNHGYPLNTKNSSIYIFNFST